MIASNGVFNNVAAYLVSTHSNFFVKGELMMKLWMDTEIIVKTILLDKKHLRKDPKTVIFSFGLLCKDEQLR